MQSQRLLRNSLILGGIATAVTTAAVVLLGRAEDKPATAALNAVSHIAFGEEATEHEELSPKYTVVGTLLNAVAVTGWSAVHEVIFGRRGRAKPVEALVTGAAISGLAYATDYHAVPKRFTPGFEKKLSSRSLATIYGLLALSLAAGAMLRKT